MAAIKLKGTYVPGMRAQYPHVSAYRVESAEEGVPLDFPEDNSMRTMLRGQKFQGAGSTFFVERKEGKIVACFPKGASKQVREKFLTALAAHKKTKALAS